MILLLSRGFSSAMEKHHKRHHRNRTKLRFSGGDGDSYSSKNAPSNSPRARSSNSNNDHGSSFMDAKRIKYDNEVKMQINKADIESPTVTSPSNSIARIEIEAGGAHVLSPRQKLHYSEVNFIKVEEVDDDQVRTFFNMISICVGTAVLISCLAVDI